MSRPSEELLPGPGRRWRCAGGARAARSGSCLPFGPHAAAQSSALSPSGSARPRAQHIIGQISAEQGSTWTVKATDGQTYTVTLSANTKFGSKKHPTSREQLKIGSQVRVDGTISGTTITASEIRTL
jgi:hypothetical protein